MTDGRCEPPKGTPVGTVCVLTGGGISDKWYWDGKDWHVNERNPYKTSPARMATLGWRFVRVVDTKAKPYRDPSVQWWE